jgi:CheY-like chemotaxis protein
MARIRLLHWKASEARAYIDLLEAAGHRVDYDEKFRPALMRMWRESPPDAFVIDLSRLPSHGREIAIALRHSRATRHIPIVFCEGADEKVQRVRSELPDATYSTRVSLKPALRDALKKRPEAPVVPMQMMDRYTGRSAAQKLGIKERSTIGLIDPPRDFARIIGELPKHVEVFDDTTATTDVTLCFVHDMASLQRRFSELRGRATATRLWIVWRKGGSGARGDVTEQVVRDCGIDLGLVDYKICSVNETWSAMAFAKKRQL